MKYLVEIILHETVHAYLDQQNVHKNHEHAQHVDMVNLGYTDAEITSLMQIFPNLSAHDAACIVLGGYGDIGNPTNSDGTPNPNYPLYQGLLTKYSVNPYDVQDANDVVNTNNDFKTHAKGTPQ